MRADPNPSAWERWLTFNGVGLLGMGLQLTLMAAMIRMGVHYLAGDSTCRRSDGATQLHLAPAMDVARSADRLAGCVRRTSCPFSAIERLGLLMRESRADVAPRRPGRPRSNRSEHPLDRRLLPSQLCRQPFAGLRRQPAAGIARNRRDRRRSRRLDRAAERRGRERLPRLTANDARRLAKLRTSGGRALPACDGQRVFCRGCLRPIARVAQGCRGRRDADVPAALPGSGRARTGRARRPASIIGSGRSSCRARR